MALKIYKKGAYVVINNNGKLTELNSAEVSITKDAEAIDIYEVKHNGVPVLKAQLSDIKDENGVAYVEAAWDIFRYQQTGSVNSSEVANPYPAPTTTTVNISSAQILAMGTTPIVLLSAPGANMYYDWSVRLEHNHVTTGYTLTGDTFVCGGGTSYYGCYFYNFALGGYDEAIMMNPAPDFLRTVSAVNYPTFSGQKMNDALVLTTLNGTNPTLGNGTWRAIITYTVRTFGA
jgi:hypothetical protein